MKALVIKQPGVAAIEGVREPEPKEGEALLRVRRVGLCGSDLNSFRGRNPMVSFPRIPGHEIAATIVAMRGEAAGLAVGMDVTVLPYTSCGKCAACLNGRSNACVFNETLGVQRDGALTELIAAPLEKLYPAKLNLKELCLVEPLTVGFHAVARARVAKNDTVAIFGCGGVGLGAVAASAFREALTIAVDIDDAKLETAKLAGAAHTVHSQRQDVKAVLAELTGGLGPQVVIEAVGMPETYRAAVEVVASTGRVVYIGYAKEPICYETKLFVQKELDIMGTRNAKPEDFLSVIAMLEQRRFPVEATVSAMIPLRDAPQVFSAWSANPNRFTKIMVTMDE